MIRLLTQADLPTVAELESDAEGRFAALDLDLALPSDPTPEHELIEAIHDGLAFGFEHEGALVGFTYASVVGDAVFVEEVSVRVSASGRRIGARLLDRLDAAADQLGLRRLVLTTFAEVPWNAPYYARIGFSHGAGSLGATLLSSEAARGFDEDQRVAMERAVVTRDAVLTEVFETAQAAPATLARVRALLDDAFEGDFSDDDWAHALGGLHVIARQDGDIVAHASAIPRTLYVGSAPWDAGYVEAVAVQPALQGTGLGTRVMRALQVRLRSRHDMLALSTGEGPFYARLGWQPWRGPTFVVRDGRAEHTPEDDGGIYVLSGLRPLPPRTGHLGCEARPGDVW